MASNAEQAFDEAWRTTPRVLNKWGGDETPASAYLERFDEIFSRMYVGQRVTSSAVATYLFLHPSLPDRTITRFDTGQVDFRSEFREQPRGSEFIDQTHHFATYFSAGLNSDKADLLYAL